LPALGDVGAGTRPHLDAPGRVTHRPCVAREPAIFAVGAAQAMLGAIVVAGADGLAPRANAGRAILGMNEVEPAAADERALRQAPVARALRADVIQRAVRRGRQYHLWQGLDDALPAIERMRSEDVRCHVALGSYQLALANRLHPRKATRFSALAA